MNANVKKSSVREVPQGYCTSEEFERNRQRGLTLEQLKLEMHKRIDKWSER